MLSHCGLYFTDTHIHAARKEQAREPLRSAWSLLRKTPPAEALPLLVSSGLRWRFDDDREAGLRAAALLAESVFPAGGDFESLRTLAALGQSFEMLRPLLPPEAQSRWAQAFAGHVAALPASAAYHERVWRLLLDLIAAIVCDDTQPFPAIAESFRRSVREDIHPDGYVRPAVEEQPEGSYLRHIACTQALVLLAEAGQHAGLDLWRYEHRGVSVVTAVAYPLYYYYFPQKWRWFPHLSEEEAQSAFRQHGGFLEIVQRQRPLHDIGLLLKEWRPLWDICGGGLTTLTHAAPSKRRLFG
ncbi:MAG: alginate lyase family protein [Chloroflexi bacterium]|nr:alginate lyase family protein [Chloroflexota bacterium]